MQRIYYNIKMNYCTKLKLTALISSFCILFVFANISYAKTVYDYNKALRVVKVEDNWIYVKKSEAEKYKLSIRIGSEAQVCMITTYAGKKVKLKLGTAVLEAVNKHEYMFKPNSLGLKFAPNLFLVIGEEYRPRITSHEHTPGKGGGVVAKPVAPTIQQQGELGGVKNTGTLIVLSEPAAQVIINDEPRGETPLTIEMPPGEVEVVLKANGIVKKETVLIVRGETRQLSHELRMGTLWLNSMPWANIIINGKSVGTTPLQVNNMLVGQHTIVFSRKGFATQQKEVILEYKKIKKVSVRLNKI